MHLSLASERGRGGRSFSPQPYERLMTGRARAGHWDWRGSASRPSAPSVIKHLQWRSHTDAVCLWFLRGDERGPSQPPSTNGTRDLTVDAQYVLP